jgi:hypothetical protein
LHLVKFQIRAPEVETTEFVTGVLFILELADLCHKILNNLFRSILNEIFLVCVAKVLKGKRLVNPCDRFDEALRCPAVDGELR